MLSEVSLDSYPQMRESVKKMTGGKTSVPQIFFNEYYVGGNDDLQKLVNDGYIITFKRIINFLIKLQSKL